MFSSLFNATLRSILRMGAVVAMMTFASAGAQAQLVTNGGFETGDFSGWTQNGDTSFTTVVGAADFIHSGSFGAELGPIETGTLSQDIATTVGKTYRLSFWLKNPPLSDGEEFAANAGPVGDPPSPSSFTASLGANTLYTVQGVGPDDAFTKVTEDYTATASNTTLQFAFVNVQDFFGLDDVVIREVPAAATPEPGSMALMVGMGVTSAVCLTRRKRVQKAV